MGVSVREEERHSNPSQPFVASSPGLSAVQLHQGARGTTVAESHQREGRLSGQGEEGEGDAAEACVRVSPTMVDDDFRHSNLAPRFQLRDENYEREFADRETYERELNERGSYERELSEQENYERDLSEQENYERELSDRENYERELGEQESYERELTERENYERELARRESYERELAVQGDCDGELPKQQNYRADVADQEAYEEEYAEQDSYRSSSNQEDYEREMSEQVAYRRGLPEEENSEEGASLRYPEDMSYLQEEEEGRLRAGEKIGEAREETDVQQMELGEEEGEEGLEIEGPQPSLEVGEEDMVENLPVFPVPHLQPVTST